MERCSRDGALAELDTITGRGSGEWYQPWDRARGCYDRHPDTDSGSVPPSRYPFSHWSDRLYDDDVNGVPGTDSLSRLAPDKDESSSPSNRSARNFLLIAGTYTPFALGPLRGG